MGIIVICWTSWFCFFFPFYSNSFYLDPQHGTGYDTEMHNMMALVAGTETWIWDGMAPLDYYRVIDKL